MEKENAELNFIQKDFQETLMALAEIMVPVAEISHGKIREGDPDFKAELEKGLDAMADKDSVKRAEMEAIAKTLLRHKSLSEGMAEALKKKT